MKKSTEVLTIFFGILGGIIAIPVLFVAMFASGCLLGVYFGWIDLALCGNARQRRGRQNCHFLLKEALRTAWAEEEFGEKKAIMEACREMPTGDLEDGGKCSARTGDSEDGDLGTPITQVYPFRIQDLPAELRCEIYSHLDYGSALRLQRASRFFRDENPHKSIDAQLRAAYIWHAETFHQNEFRLACFGCLRLRPLNEFPPFSTILFYEKYGDVEIERRCRECEATEAAS